MISKQEVCGVIADGLRPQGFVRSGATFRRVYDEVVTVVNVQTSDYDSTLYLNVGFWIRDLGRDTLRPPAHKCHVTARAEDILAARETDVQDVLYDGAQIPDIERLRILQEIVEVDLVPLCESCSTIKDLRALVRRCRHLGVQVVAHDILGVSIED